MRKHTKCSVEGCIKRGAIIRNVEYFTKGYCKTHYQRFKLHGNPSVGGRKSNFKHPLFQTYNGIRGRCYNKNHLDYHNYGGRGITVCERWLGNNGFENFVSDMGDKPTPKHSIDRIDVNGNYEPRNCRWAGIHQQAANTRKVGKCVGVIFNKLRKKWYASISLNGKRIHLGYFLYIEDAILARKEAEKKYGIAI